MYPGEQMQQVGRQHILKRCPVAEVYGYEIKSRSGFVAALGVLPKYCHDTANLAKKTRPRKSPYLNVKKHDCFNI